MDKEKNCKDVIKDVQSKMNGMDVVKRKKFLYGFALFFVAVFIVRMFMAFGSCSKDVQKTEAEKKIVAVDSVEKAQTQVLEMSLKPNVDSIHRSKEVEILLDELVRQDREEKEKKEERDAKERK